MSVRQIVTLPDDTVLVIGAGLAGLFLALKLAPRRALVLSPSPLGERAATASAAELAALVMRRPDIPAINAIRHDDARLVRRRRADVETPPLSLALAA